MEKQDRNKEVYALREQGVSFSEIARKYGICRERVRQIYFSYVEQMIDLETSPPLKKLLTVRMQHGLINCFKDESIFDDPVRIMSIKLSDYRKVQNVGKEALGSLVNGMITLGYIKKGDEWLEE